MKYKVIFSDIDGTLLTSNHKVTEGTVNAVQKISKSGIDFILVSARMPRGIIPIQKKLGINAPIICFSGALILGKEKNDGTRDIIKNTYMKTVDVKRIYNIMNNDFKDISFSLYQRNQWFVESIDNKWIKLEDEITNSDPTIHEFDLLFQSSELQVNKILCMGEPIRIDELCYKLKEIMPDLIINKSKDTYLEIMECNVLKSNAIKSLEKTLKVKRNEIIAIGDNFNDMDMIIYAGMGIAMGNSPDEVKAVADAITGINDEDGLQQAIEKYLPLSNKIIERDGHIHSHYCPHGSNDAFELYVNKAIELKLKEISFTEHMPLPGNFMDPEFLKTCSPTIVKIEEYINELDYIKVKYINQIKINTGFEVDYIEGYEEKIEKVLNKYGERLQDGLLSVHFIKFEEAYYSVDGSLKEFGKLVKALGSIEKVYDSYYETLLKAIKADLGKFKPTRIGHPTLVRIFNKKYPLDYNNVKLLEEIVKEIKIRNYEVDFNTAGIRKPYCGEIYPSGIFAELVKSNNIKIVYGSDAHMAEDVGKNFK